MLPLVYPVSASRWRWPIAVAVSALLGACGGGGSSSQSRFDAPDTLPVLSASMQPQGSTPVLLRTPVPYRNPKYGSSTQRTWFSLQADGTGLSAPWETTVFQPEDWPQDSARAFWQPLRWRIESERLVIELQDLQTGQFGARSERALQWTHRDDMAGLIAVAIDAANLVGDWTGAQASGSWGATAVAAQAGMVCTPAQTYNTWTGTLSLKADGTYSASLAVNHGCAEDGRVVTLRDGHPMLSLSSGQWALDGQGQVVFADNRAGRVVVPVEAAVNDPTAAETSICLGGAQLQSSGPRGTPPVPVPPPSALPIRANLPLTLRSAEGCGFSRTVEDHSETEPAPQAGKPRHLTLHGDGRATAYMDRDTAPRGLRWQLDGEVIRLHDEQDAEILKLHRGWQTLQLSPPIDTAAALAGAWDARSSFVWTGRHSGAWDGRLHLQADGRYTSTVRLSMVQSAGTPQPISRPLSRLAQGRWRYEPATRQIELVEDGLAFGMRFLVAPEPSLPGQGGPVIQIDGVQFVRTTP